MDPVFAQEQEHLSATHAKLRELEHDVAERLAANLREVQDFRSVMNEELSQNFDGDDISMETYAEYAVMNNVVDSFNIAIDLDGQTLARIRQLLRKPYFAKVVLDFPGKDELREVYLGSTGVADESHRQLIVDWRSPVAETYYNQQTGPMSYLVEGRKVNVDLKLRRQFDLEADRLKTYFDTTVAIEDPLLLASLAAGRTASLQAITATIQREQNQVIRHEDVPALLVKGIAGSGKTSVMLQRIAYLLFRERKSLNADQVYLISPNPVFARYIQNVLPELGEKNPHTLMWSELVKRLGPGDRSLGNDVPPQTLKRIDTGISKLKLEADDLNEVRVGDRCLISVPQMWRVVEKFLKRVAPGPRLALLVEEDLIGKLERKVEQLVSKSSVQDEMLALDDDEQERIFGHVIAPLTDEDLRECTRQYLDHICKPAFEMLENTGWLRFDRVGMRLLGQQSISGAEWIYLKMAFTGKVDASAKFVMVDEVQDYSVTQLTVLARYFSRAHFLLLGDPNQAVRPGTASFDEIRGVFERARGSVSECFLMTSYRSSPQITELFARLMPHDERIQISSVQHAGGEPRMAAFQEVDAYRDALVDEVRAMRSSGCLGAVIVNSKRRVHWLGKLLQDAMGDDAPLVMREGSALPREGVVVIDLELAKGLEFDRIVLADASAEEFPAGDDVARRRLYVAISRATQQVALFAQGELTEWVR